MECCKKLFERLECMKYCRFDWRLDAKGHPRLLEVNPNPGWCRDGHLAKMAKFAEMSCAEMIQAILDTAEQRLQSPHVSDVHVCTETTRTAQLKSVFNRS